MSAVFNGPSVYNGANAGSASGGGGGGGGSVESVTGSPSNFVNNTDPANPIVTVSAENVGAFTNSLTEKTTPIDADMVQLMDSAAANAMKKLSWTNIKATLKAYFDTLYGDGDVVGPASAGDNTIVLMDGSTGKLIKGSLTELPNGTNTQLLANGGFGDFANVVVSTGLAYNEMTGYLTATGETPLDVVTITADTTLDSTYWYKKIIYNSPTSITITLPDSIAAGVWFEDKNIGAGTVSFIKTGTDGLDGNTTLASGANSKKVRNSSTVWSIEFGGTATLNMPNIGPVVIDLTTSQTDYIVPFVGGSATLLGIYQRCRALTTAGTFKIQLNGADITGLTGIVPSTAGSYTAASSAVNLVRGDQLSIVADGSLIAVLGLGLTPDYTQTF